MYITILILPLISAIISGLLGRKIGVTGSHLLSCILLALAAILSILGLLEVVTKISQQFYDKYSLDITKYRTLPSAIFAAYTSNYYDESYNIKRTNGFIEKNIRSAYFGGNVDVFEHVVPNGPFI